MKLDDATQLICDEVKKEVADRKGLSGSIEIKVNYNQGAVNDVHIQPKRIYNKPIVIRADY